ncbi:MAG: hypothetical protein MPEBLZ_02152, partial [Candidatus Methanoperedens nitroreducens]
CTEINCTKQGIKAMGAAVAEVAISDIMGDEKYMRFARSYYPPDIFENLSKLGVMPGSAGRELLDSGHETSMGTMADPAGSYCMQQGWELLIFHHLS